MLNKILNLRIITSRLGGSMQSARTGSSPHATLNYWRVRNSTQRTMYETSPLKMATR